MDGETFQLEPVMPLRIGVNALFLVPGGVGGTEIYLRFLVDALARLDRQNQYAIFLNEETDAELVPPNSNFCAVRCPVRASFRPGRILFEQIRLPLLLERHRIDVLLNPGFTSPLRTRVPRVTVFHDLQYKRHPEFFRVRDLPFWNLLLAGAARCSARLIAVSESTAHDLAEYLPRARGKISVVPHGVDPAFFCIGETRLKRDRTIHAGRPFVLIVSTLHPHKNLERAIDAFWLFRAAHPEYRLVIAGLKGFAARKLEDLVERTDLGEHVRFTGWIPRAEVYELYRDASVFLAPSLFEGFGMPLVEAMAAGIPVACSSIPPFIEIAGGVAHFFDPSSAEAMAAALEAVTADEGFHSRARFEGPERARRFSWDKCAEATLCELTSLGLRLE